jgi:predicted nucleic acid-binding Zn ribbon protein
VPHGDKQRRHATLESFDVMDDAQLKTVWEQRQFPPPASPLGVPLAMLMKRKIGKRVKQLSKLAEVWDEVLPQSIREHTALEGLNNGVLTVIVDSASHRFQLQTLLNAGLTSQIQELLPQALNKIRLVPGQFCSIDVSGAPRYQF